jgi:AcrR family transcriptional regulator
LHEVIILKKQARRARHDSAATKSLILDSVEQLMLEEGYAAVSIRRVATQAGLMPPLVQYHFPTTDEMLVSAYRRTTETNFAAIQAAANSPDPLHALWSLQSDATHTALAMEFMALANHRKVIKAEIADYAKRSRIAKAEVFSKCIDASFLDPNVCSPLCATTLMVAIGRTLITENAVGISIGHKEVRGFVEWIIQRLEQHKPGKVGARQPKAKTSTSRRASAK